MNNYQWLLQMDGADRKAWFDAEHVETEERALDGDTAALNARINELRALSQLLDTVTDGMGKVSAILDNYDEGMA